MAYTGEITEEEIEIDRKIGSYRIVKQIDKEDNIFYTIQKYDFYVNQGKEKYCWETQGEYKTIILDSRFFRYRCFDYYKFKTEEEAIKKVEELKYNDSKQEEPKILEIINV